MTTFKAQWMLLGVAVIAAANAWSVARAKDELPKAVRQVLSAERQVSETHWNRRQQLGEEVVKTKNSAEEVRWHAGYVKVSGKWLPFEDAITPEPMNGITREYLNRRDKAEQTWTSQTALANWCSQHGQPEQSLAHNYHGLMFAPRNADTSQNYQRMGYIRFGSQWLSPQEAFQARRELVEYLEQLDVATPAVSQFADELEAGRLPESSLRDRLKQLANPNKIAALELVLAPRSERCGQAAVEALRQIPTYQTSQALGRIAVYSPWLFVRESAIDSLKDRRWEDFVPQWLSMMRTPITTEFQRVTWGSHQGMLCLFRSERSFEVEVGQLLVWAPNTVNLDRRGREMRGSQMYRPEVARQLLNRIRTSELELRQMRYNDQVEQLNDLLIAALQTTTGQLLENSPKDWWDWWQLHSGLSAMPTSEKQTVVIVKEDARLNLPRVASCLVAGTPIRTERGLVAIERIQPGDRVLAKDIETGELAYKVVLHTTVREPFPVTKVAIGDETIQATEGHHFWVSGRGWTKTRELAAEQPLHTPIGVTRVASTEPAESAPTYNLVVADFHTYFVGKSAILSHDVLPPKPTNKVVPGLNDD